MRGVFAVIAGLLGFALAPLGVSPLTSWTLVPVHLGFTLVISGLQVVDALGGRPERVRGWLVWFVLASGGALGTLQVAAWTREVGLAPWPHAWWLPLTGAVCWSWVPVAVGLAGGGLAEQIADARSRAAVRRRRAEG